MIFLENQMCPKYSDECFECECNYCVKKKIERCPNSTKDALCYCGACERKLCKSRKKK